MIKEGRKLRTKMPPRGPSDELAIDEILKAEKGNKSGKKDSI